MQFKLVGKDKVPTGQNRSWTAQGSVGNGPYF